MGFDSSANLWGESDVADRAPQGRPDESRPDSPYVDGSCCLTMAVPLAYLAVFHLSVALSETNPRHFCEMCGVYGLGLGMFQLATVIGLTHLVCTGLRHKHQYRPVPVSVVPVTIALYLLLSVAGWFCFLTGIYICTVPFGI
jgi:hypothetical protein